MNKTAKQIRKKAIWFRCEYCRVKNNYTYEYNFGDLVKCPYCGETGILSNRFFGLPVLEKRK